METNVVKIDFCIALWEAQFTSGEESFKEDQDIDMRPSLFKILKSKVTAVFQPQVQTDRHNSSTNVVGEGNSQNLQNEKNIWQK